MNNIRLWISVPIVLIFTIFVFSAFILSMPMRYLVPIMTNQLKAINLWILRGRHSKPRPEEG